MLVIGSMMQSKTFGIASTSVQAAEADALSIWASVLMSCNHLQPCILTHTARHHKLGMHQVQPLLTHNALTCPAFMFSSKLTVQTNRIHALFLSLSTYIYAILYLRLLVLQTLSPHVMFSRSFRNTG